MHFQCYETNFATTIETYYVAPVDFLLAPLNERIIQQAHFSKKEIGPKKGPPDKVPPACSKTQI